MACDRWQNTLVERIYGEGDSEERAAFDAHLAECAECREWLAGVTHARAALRAGAPVVPASPRLLVLAPRGNAIRPGLAFAAGIVGALLLGGGAAAGYGIAARRLAGATAEVGTQAVDPIAAEASVQRAVRDELDRRLRELESAQQAKLAASPGVPDAVTPRQLDATMARFERRLNAARASDLDWMASQIAASEQRTGERIGETRQALRYVALANNPEITAK